MRDENQNNGYRFRIKEAVRFQRGGWLNDEILNALLKLLEHSHRSLAPPTAGGTAAAAAPPLCGLYFPNTSLYSVLMDLWFVNGRPTHASAGYRYAKVATYTKKRSIVGSVTHILASVCSGTHWAHAVVRPLDPSITVYESIEDDARSLALAEALRSWVADDVAAKPALVPAGWAVRREDWRLSAPLAPQQDNDYDCGVFAFMSALYVSWGVEPDFQQSDMGQFRDYLALSILRGSL